MGDELGRGLGALGLVEVVEGVAEGGAAGVEDDGDVGAVVVLEEPGEHVGEAEDGVDRGAVLAGHGRKGMEGAEDEAGAVDEDEVIVVRHFSAPLGQGAALDPLGASAPRPASIGLQRLCLCWGAGAAPLACKPGRRRRRPR